MEIVYKRNHTDRFIALADEVEDAYPDAVVEGIESAEVDFELAVNAPDGACVYKSADAAVDARKEAQAVITALKGRVDEA